MTACSLWIELGTKQRVRLAIDLADRALAANDAGGMAAIKQLERLGLSAVEPLVRLSASQRSEVAAAAQQALGRLLTSWEIAATETGDVAALTEQIERLAAELSASNDQFGAESQGWANRLAQRMARHCDQLPAEDAWTILLYCEQVLSRPALAATPGPPSAEPTADESPDSAIDVAFSTATPTAENIQPASPSVESLAAHHAARADLSLVTSPSVVARRLPELVDNPLRPPLRLPAEPGEHSPTKRTAESAGQAEQVAASVQPPAGPVVDVPSPQDVRLLARRLRELSDRQLMERVGSVERAEAAAARQALHERGYSDAIIDITRQLEALPAPERRVWLEQTSHLPPVETRRLLRWFVADADAEVRLQALTTLATTGDPKLAELARERAVEDADPRVAALAAELIRGR